MDKIGLKINIKIKFGQILESTHFLIFYVSKIKFRKSRLIEKCSKKVKKLFSNLILQKKIEYQKQSEN